MNMITYNDKKYICHLDLVMDQIRKKWKAVILCNIGNSTIRFTQLQKQLDSISQKVLSESLRELESENFINKTINSTFPLKVEYSLTSKGKEILSILQSLEKWSEKYNNTAI